VGARSGFSVYKEGFMQINDFTRNWIIGNFDPSLLKADFEVQCRKDTKGDKHSRHFHKQVTEYVVQLGGKHRVDGTIYGDGDIFIVPPFRSVDYECLETGYTVCVKDKSIPEDKFEGDCLNIVMPMAGRSSRFFGVPKVLIPVDGKPMINRVIDNIRPEREHRFIFVCLKEHRKGLDPLLSDLGHIVWIDDVTEGAACTVLKAKELINNNDPLMISDCDQLIEMDFNRFYDHFFESDYEAMFTSVESDNPAFSYAKIENGRVVETAEKKVISNISPCGKHLYKKGKYYVKAAENMIQLNKRVNNEFYVSPVYNEMLFRKIGHYPVTGWWDIGTPDNLQRYLDDHKKTNL
jgi:choline kinase